jgi:hypothetical protein
MRGKQLDFGKGVNRQNSHILPDETMRIGMWMVPQGLLVQPLFFPIERRERKSPEEPGFS